MDWEGYRKLDILWAFLGFITVNTKFFPVYVARMYRLTRIYINYFFYDSNNHLHT
jgi:hypothetical protein